LNILLLNSLGIYGGGEFFVCELAAYLKASGNKIWVGCRKDTPLFKKCAEAGINTALFDFPEKGTGKLGKNIKAVRDFAEKNRVQIIHSNTNYDRTAGAAAAGLEGIKHIASVHSLQSISHNFTHWARNKFFIDAFIADGNIVKEFLMKKDKIEQKKIRVINLGIDPAFMKRDERLRKDVRNEFGIKDNEYLIGNLGRLVEFKGQDKLINAFKIVAERFHSVKLLIVGDGELKDMLENLAQQNSLKDKVIFSGFRNDLQAVYSAFDIYVHTSNDGGGELFPFAVLYAMAAGLPVVSTSVGEIPNIVQDRINGFITGHKPDEISKGIITLLEDSSLIKKMGEEGFKRLNNEFTLEKMGIEILKLYDETLRIRNI
jgi:L-malate glycosyltransferase